MKGTILSVAVLLLSTTMFAQKKANDIAKFAAETIDQGKLKQNNPEEVKFVVTNISNEPLIIEQANPTCGCTIGDYTKTPISPGATGYVSAKFNAANTGHFTKTLTVKFAGADDVKNIVITGDVLTAEEYDKLKGGNTAAPAMVKAQPAKPTPVAIKAKPVKTVKAKKPATANKG
jgi:Protein of unknown function (DUF1573)